jgi:UDP-2,4-diacetamido-2,4,6-trideoxy-beta-L-altropyranose hydrolase
MKIVFRTDASLRIGTGHVMRCLTLASELRRRGMDCRFACRPMEGDLFQRIREEGFEILALPDAEGTGEGEGSEPWLAIHWQEDAEQTIHAMEGFRPDWLVVDHYGLDARWEMALRPHCARIMAIDDRADRPHDIDLLLDQNLVADLGTRYQGLLSEQAVPLLGPRYALLQPIYPDLHPRTPPRLGPVRRILIYFGGADNDNHTGQAIEAFLGIGRADIILDVVTNPSCLWAEDLRKQVRGHANIQLHESLPSLAHLMAIADLAIGAGGATSWERCCLGLPALVAVLADNQQPIAEELNRRGMVRIVGDGDSVMASSWRAALKEVLEDREGLADWSDRCRTLLDGRGAGRVADILALGTDTSVVARPARLDDESWILEREAGPTRTPANEEATPHKAWFYDRLRQHGKYRLYILETARGTPLGHTCYEKKDECWEIQWTSYTGALGSHLVPTLLTASLHFFRASEKGPLAFSRMDAGDLAYHWNSQISGVSRESKLKAISVCSDAGSWINASVPGLLLSWLARGIQCTWVHDARQLPGGDLCFYLSYGRIVDHATRSKYARNLVVHASDLPKGRGWSPSTWMILEGLRRITVTLLEAEDEVDSGAIYSQDGFDVEPSDLVDQWREKLAASTVRLVADFVDGFPESVKAARMQVGEASHYPRRRAKDSELDPDKNIREQFNILQVVDNESYPAFFFLHGRKFELKIQVYPQVLGKP